MMWGYGYDYGALGLLHGIFSLIWTIFVIVVIISVIRWALWGRRHRGRWHDAPWHHNSALDILKERYAKSEIDKAEFEEKKKDLEG